MREATDEWLTRELSEWWAEAGTSEPRQDAVVAAIADRATAALRRPRIARGVPPHLRRQRERPRGPRYVCEGRQMANFQAWEPTTPEEIDDMLGSREPRSPSG